MRCYLNQVVYGFIYESVFSFAEVVRRNCGPLLALIIDALNY
jgi:hypothetical protein